MICLTDDYRKYDDVMTVSDLMEYLAIGKNTAYKLLKEGQIKSFKIGRVYKIPKKAIEDYVNKNSRVQFC